jgi:3-mercaptopyruvate sulfurtransferase SseA
LKELGRNISNDNTKMYDAGWNEWKEEKDLPKIWI